MRGEGRRGRAVAVGAAVFLVALCALGCGTGGGTSDPKTGLELQIQQQLPKQAEQRLGTAVTVPEVTCTSITETTFDCLATLSGYDLRGRPVSQSLPIEGSCDEEACIWNSKGF
jgi:hypothetical protein